MRPVAVQAQSAEAESAVLGAILRDGRAIESVASILSADAFYNPTNAAVYAHLIERYICGDVIDVLAVADALDKAGTLKSVGGKVYIHSLLASVVSSATITTHAKIVDDNYRRRQFVAVFDALAHLASTYDGELSDLLEQADKQLFDLCRAKHDGAEAFSELLRETYTEIEAVYENKGKLIGYDTGFFDLDRLLTGILPGDLVIIAARPAMGKTAIALNISVSLAKEDIPTAIYSLEMSKKQLLQRIICAESQVNSRRIRVGDVRDEDWSRMAAGMGRLAALPITINDNSSIGLLEIKAGARRFFSEQKKQGVIVVDYLQLMEHHKRTENRQQEVAALSRGLKVLAKELNVPVIALSQLSRAGEKREVKRPQLSDLRDSGGIEQDADIVIFLHRQIEPQSGNYDSETEVTIAKHRKGEIGPVRLLYQEEYTRFVNKAK